MKRKSRKTQIVLWTSICLILLGALMGSIFHTGGGAVDVRDILIITEDGAELHALLYVPKQASSANPLPAVVAAHGYNNTAEVQGINSIELSRRGYVVIAPDEYGHGGSSFATENDGIVLDMGVYAAMQYLGTLPYVDSGQVGLVGHSMGGSTIQYAAKRAWDNRADGQDVVAPVAILPTAQSFITDADGNSLLESYPVNMGVVYGQYDEWAEGMWGVKKGSEINTTAKAQAIIGVDLPQYGTYYDYQSAEAVDRGGAVAAAQEGNLRVMFQPSVVHPVVHFSFEAAEGIVDFFDITLRGGNATIAPDSQIWFWKDVFTGLSLIGFFLFIASFGLMLLEMPYFSTIVRPQPLAPSNPVQPKSKLIYLVIFILCLLPAPLLYNWAIGYPIDIKSMGRTVDIVFPANAVFPMPVMNGLTVFNLCTAVISLLIFCVVYNLYMKRNGVTAENIGVRLPGKEIVKALLLAVTAFVAGYGLLVLCDFFFKTDLRFWVFSAKTLTAPKILMLLTYLPVFAVTFLVSSLTLNSFTRLRNAKEWVNVLLMILASCGGLAVLCAVDYISLFATGVKLFPYIPFTDGVTSALAGVLLWNLLFILPISAVLSRVFFKKSGSIWVGGFMNAFVVTFFAMSNTVVSAGVL